MQLMPGTVSDLGVNNPFDVSQNIRGGAHYLADMLKQFNGDERLAAAAYNAGPQNVQKYNARCHRSTRRASTSIASRHCVDAITTASTDCHQPCPLARVGRSCRVRSIDSAAPLRKPEMWTLVPGAMLASRLRKSS